MAGSSYVAHNLYFNYYITSDTAGRDDLEYQQFLRLVNDNPNGVCFGKVQEIRCNIFNLFPEYSLVTSVSADFQMNRGILKKFEISFNNIDRLRAENVRTGGVAYLHYDNSFVYYLVIKSEYYSDPTYYAVWATLQALKNHVVANNVRKLAFTQLAACSDTLQWSVIKQMIEYIYRDVNIEIVAVDITIPLNNFQPVKANVID